MARLSEMVSEMAATLQVPEKTVSVCARHLRRAGLIRQVGRGPSAAHMTPTDATNLLLGIMTSSTLQDAPANVRLAREAIFEETTNPLEPGERSPDLPPYQFLRDSDGNPRPFGEAVDALLDEMVRHGDPRHDEGLPTTHFGLRVERPGLENAFELDHRYRVEFRRQDPRLDGYTGDDLHNKAVEVYGRAGPALHTVALVYMDALHRIADFLRGYEPERGEVVEPVYEAEK